MIYINNKNQEPWYNLALEEYFLKNTDIDEDIVILWQNKNAVIIGKNQNVASQLNQKYAANQGVSIARRMTGGGAVYHDLGNLNFTFITNYDDGKKNDFKEFAEPIVDALENLGLNAELSGRNDILIEGRKISGTAQAVAGKRIIFHGTLMYDVNTEVLDSVLNVDIGKIKAKGIESIKSRVTNMKQYLPDDVGINEIKNEILNVISYRNGISEYCLTDYDKMSISELVEKKYHTTEWIFGESGEGEIHNRRRFDGGEVEFNFSINNGCIVKCKITGDFIGLYDVCDIECELNGCMYEYETVKNLLSEVDIKKYFGDISNEEILTCIFDI